MKKIQILVVVAVIVCLCPLTYEVGRNRGRKEIWDIWLKTNDPNWISDSNDWEYLEPDNPILSIISDTIRLQPGSSIKYIEVGDPNVEVSYFEPNLPVNLAIESNLPGFLIKDCYFGCIRKL